jgi:hypothetical protein
MRKKLLYLLMIMMSGMLRTAFAQNDNGFQVRFSVVDATCYNNGKVVYALTDMSGAVLDTLPPQLSQVRVYYRLNEADSAHYAGWYYAGGTDTMTINYGTYIVGVEGLLADSTGGFTRVDTQTVLTIATLYQKPTAAVVPFEARFNRNDAGTLSTITCEDIGRVQLRILYGQFPYTVAVMDNATGDTLRTVSFSGRQYNGTFEASYNYKDYYSIDSLPGGVWAFHVEDGCGYGLPNVVATVSTQKLNSPSSIGVIASSGNFSDTNVVKISLDYISPVNELMEFFSRYARYRFRFGDDPADEWRPVPSDAEVTGRYVHFTDTVGTVARYCDLWERNFTFEYEMSGCGTASLTKSFQIMKPNALYFDKDSVDIDDSTRMSDGGCAREQYWHRQSYSIRYYKSGASPQYSPDNRSKTNADDEYYRYHYTHPITWVYTDTRTGTVIKRDTVPIITDKSYLSVNEVTSIYGEWSDSVFVIPVERKLLDGRGCELYTTFDSLRYVRCVSSSVASWKVSRKDNGDKCCTSPRLVRVYRFTEFGGPADSTVIRLVRSPYNNLYNFEAVYHAADKSWTIVKDSVGNTAAVTGGALGDELIISDYCLPSGPYDFEVTTTCGTQLLQSRASFNDYMVMRQTEEIECISSRDCGNLYIHYPHGAYQWVKTNTSSQTGLPVDTVFENIPMKATVMEAPSASLKGSESYGTPHFTFSMPGTYVLRVCPNLAVDECSSYICRYDTFFLDAATVEFEEALAVLCDASSTEGSAWVRAGNGTPPYTFTLYDQPDKQGNILAVNNTGVFPNIPMHSDQTLSCLVQDSCSAYFHVNFQPVAIAGLQKLWFDGGLTETTACEGSTLQIHALAIGDIWQYEWSGPNGFTATTADPYAFVPRGSGGGWYKVVIRQTSCTDEISDSIFLTVLPSPTLELAPDTTVCPGEVVQVRFTPHSDAPSGTIPFSIAFENASGVRIRQYSSTSGVTVTDTFSTRSPAKIYPVSVQDNQCEYLLADPEDTIHIALRTDVANACRVITTFDTVCYGGDAHLSATATDSVPYILRWFGDYDQTHLLKTDTLWEEGSWSDYDTAGILRKTLLYVSLQKDGECPSVNGLTDSVMAMCDGETVLSCGRHIRFYDSGGSEGGSGMGEHLIHQFRTSDSTRVSIHFDDLALAGAAHLMVFTGEEPNADSLLLDLTEGSAPSQTAVSTGNLLTVCFLGNRTKDSDWSAVVEASPGIAVADVRRSNTTLYKDEVCQSQTNTYDDPYGMAPDVVSADELARAIRKAGNYYYTKTFPAADRYGCDSTVNFHLTVNPPVEEETVATVSRQSGYLWHDSLYTESGRHTMLRTASDGCDRLNVLYLTVFDAESPDAEICRGDSVTLTLSASVYNTSHNDALSIRRARPGDVLCDDGSLLPIDSFFTSGKTPMGVVFHVDETGIHGLAVALTETSRVFSLTSPYQILSTSYFTLANAVRDSDGEVNTLHLKTIDAAYSGVDFASDATAASYCYYFNHRLLAPDGLHHGWFLPSSAELNLLQGSAWEVKQSINRICQTNSTYKNFSSSRYWSSTFRNGSQVWTFSNTEWSGQNLSNLYGVRPVKKF